jgi:hypothetical protein
MINLSQYLTEWKQDMMPQCIVVMGGPGAGKTYWMDNNAKRFFQNNITPRKLDSDWNLAKFQKQHLDEVAEQLLLAILPDAVSDARSQKEAFKIALQQEQEAMDAAVDYGRISRTLDISDIDFDFVQQWAKRYANAQESQKESVMGFYKKAFRKAYFNTLFASDFSVRKFSKEEYKKHFQQKLKGELEDIDFVGISDVIIAITGDELKKFEEIVDVCGETHSITVVYLDVPAEMSVRQDADRSRSLGKELVLKILGEVHNCWEQLVDAYKGMGITKLVHMTTDPDLKHPQWKVEKEYINYELLKKG